MEALVKRIWFNTLLYQVYINLNIRGPSSTARGFTIQYVWRIHNKKKSPTEPFSNHLRPSRGRLQVETGRMFKNSLLVCRKTGSGGTFKDFAEVSVAANGYSSWGFIIWPPSHGLSVFLSKTSDELRFEPRPVRYKPTVCMFPFSPEPRATPLVASPFPELSSATPLP